LHLVLCISGGGGGGGHLADVRRIAVRYRLKALAFRYVTNVPFCNVGPDRYYYTTTQEGEEKTTMDYERLHWRDDIYVPDVRGGAAAVVLSRDRRSARRRRTVRCHGDGYPIKNDEGCAVFI